MHGWKRLGCWADVVAGADDLGLNDAASIGDLDFAETRDRNRPDLRQWFDPTALRKTAASLVQRGRLRGLLAEPEPEARSGDHPKNDERRKPRKREAGALVA
jgi:hypothetical protein